MDATDSDGVSSASVSSPLSWMSWSARDFAKPSTESEALLDERRARNRESMRRAREKKRSELQHMKETVATLEQQYKALDMRAASMSEQETESDDASGLGVHLSETARRLGAENLLLKATIQAQAEWQLHVSRVVDADDERASSAAQAQQLELEITRRAFGFRPMSNDCVERVICQSTEIVRDVHARLLGMAVASPPLYVFGWRLDRSIRGTELEFVLQKQFVNVSALELMTKTWEDETRLSAYKRVKADTRRLEVLQRVHSDAIVVGRDVKHEDDKPVFRTVFLRFRMALGSGGDSPKGYVLGTQSMNHPGVYVNVDGTDEPVVWVDMTFWTEFFAETHPVTGEECCRVRWTGKTDYKSEAHAYRNAADVLSGILRWERLNVAPVLSIC